MQFSRLHSRISHFEPMVLSTRAIPMDNFIAICNRFLFKITNHAKLYIRDYKSLIIFPWRLQNSCKRGQNHACVSYAEKLSKRELEQIHLFIAECSQLWIKSVQPNFNKIKSPRTGIIETECHPIRDTLRLLFIAECSRLWIKSVQAKPAVLFTAPNPRNFNISQVLKFNC